MELRPRMLKECLLEDSNSCSSNGFKSIPRRPPLNPFPMIPNKKKKQSNALQAVINAVKNLRSNAIKSTPSGILPRSLSRRLSSSKNKAENQARITTIVRVKDIVRWRSSKDLLHEDISRFEPSPPHQYTAKTTTGSCTTTSGTSSSSWCDSDFTSEFLPSSSWGGNVEKEEGGENYKLQCVGEDSSTAVTDADTVVGPEEDLQCEEEQNSPVSVLEIQHDEASDSSFSQCLDNVERTKQKLMETIQRFESLANISPFNLDEWDEESCKDESCDTEIENDTDDEVEEKAAKLWDRVKERHAIWIHEEHLIMDYFRDELMQRTNDTNQDFEEQLVREARGWLEGQRVSELECGTGEQRRQACAREIERLEWNEKRMKEEREEVALQVEDGLFSLLMSETLNALFE
ncbi:unnamed protein product [Eruca vesicaria subsp. sativa]|uniref:DUF4378 domain-containing protein n=1 Tax=Eruca vesicaria subsp. sativa TaxID=29727 RepID=A0ABC8JE02_ERUVS|nr:unnamed protein product [Eruca vesicaria subsp. sativa]